MESIYKGRIYKGRRTVYHPFEGGGNEIEIPEDLSETRYGNPFREPREREPPRPRIEDLYR